ncbi:hypothetical protein GF361_03940 [Candidatus Woesearchaeota archaeon]|nr:hypothetical protein [Candidatus Woesearchaeota archaeon]
MEEDVRMQEVNLDALVRNNGFQFTETFFPYTSGQIGPYYIQSVVVEKNGEDYVQAIQDMAVMIRKTLGIKEGEPDYIISGGESRDWDFSNPVAYDLGLPHAKIYKNGKLLGVDMKKKHVIHVADLNNEGSSPRDKWVPAINQAGGEIKHIFFYVDRMEDGVEVMKELGLESHSVVPLDEHAWQYLQDKDVISKEVYNSLNKRMEDKQTWAEDMLRSKAGFETLANLYGDEKTIAKAQKILNVGYLDLKEELAQRLEKEYNLKPELTVGLQPGDSDNK